VDTFTGLMLGYGTAGSPGVPSGPRPAWAPDPVADLHTGGAVMWVGGDALMFGLMMLVFLMWSMDERSVASGRGWLEAARRNSLATLVAARPAPVAPAPAGTAAAVEAGPAGSAEGGGGDPGPAPADVSWNRPGGIDDDEHLAAYNAFLARLNEAESGRKK
jgi:hypothetical protein